MPIKSTTRESYARRMARVVDYLVDHLDGELDWQRLAEEAALSPYHFHRVYHGLTGETVADTVRRLKLNRAAVKLISSATPITAIAREAGYGGVPAFSRAFREAYGMPPAAYRAAQSRAALRAAAAKVDGSFEVVIREVRPAHVAALPHRGEYMDIGRAFEKLSAWAAGAGHLAAGTRSFGIYYDDPAAVPAPSLRAEACLAVPRGTPMPPGMHARDTPGGRCAMLVYQGPYASLETPYRWLYGTWLPASGEEPRDAPCFEEYLNDARVTPPTALLTAIYLPLEEA